jgi:hypothetical protein
MPRTGRVRLQREDEQFCALVAVRLAVPVPVRALALLRRSRRDVLVREHQRSISIIKYIILSSK